MINTSFLAGMQDKVNNQNNVTQHIMRKRGAPLLAQCKEPTCQCRRDAGLILEPERSHMPQYNKARVTQLLSLRPEAREPRPPSLRPGAREPQLLKLVRCRACGPQQEKPLQ